MRTTFVDVLSKQAVFDDKIFLLTPDMGFSIFESFAEKYPDRFLNTGIAEQNTVGVAAGLALYGFKPYIYSIAPFALVRCLEQIRISAAYMQLNIKIVGGGGGFAYGPLGATHHIIEDFAFSKVLPNMIVCAPADPVEARQIFEQSLHIPSPMYIRLAKSKDPIIHNANDIIIIGKSFSFNNGHDLEILTTGTITCSIMEWIPKLHQQGISAGITVFPTIKPLDVVFLDKLMNSEKRILIVEEHNVIGGLGESICSYFGKKNAKNKIRHLGIPDTYSHFVGSQQFILDKFGIFNVPDIQKIFE